MISHSVIIETLSTIGKPHWEIVQIHSQMIERELALGTEKRIQDCQNLLLVRIAKLGIQPLPDGSFTEAQACLILNKSEGYIRQNRFANRPTPEGRKHKHTHVYTLQALAQYQANS